MKSRLWLYLSLVIIAACNSQEEAAPEDNLGIKGANEKREANLAMIAEMKQNIQDGDLILRTGNDYSSEQIKLFSKTDQTYSHAGIAVHDSGDIYVYHVVPDYFHVKDKTRKEKLDSFCNPVVNIGLGLARYKMDSSEVKAFIQYLDKQYQKNSIRHGIRSEIKRQYVLFRNDQERIDPGYQGPHTS